ncbi:Hypothetical predicted protein, partial [Olea europaea subsp. europaea]
MKRAKREALCSDVSPNSAGSAIGPSSTAAHGGARRRGSSRERDRGGAGASMAAPRQSPAEQSKRKKSVPVYDAPGQEAGEGHGWGLGLGEGGPTKEASFDQIR